ncbi:MAG: hypothetical protein AAGJ08_07370 [Cyanobacteria bacterium P01_H01_bin.35]
MEFVGIWGRKRSLSCIYLKYKNYCAIDESKIKLCNGAIAIFI